MPHFFMHFIFQTSRSLRLFLLSFSHALLETIIKDIGYRLLTIHA